MDRLVSPAAVLAAILKAARRASPSEHASAQFRLYSVPEHGLCGTVRFSELSVRQAGAAVCVMERSFWHHFELLVPTHNDMDPMENIMKHLLPLELRSFLPSRKAGAST
jgi:hypothetical protein